MEIASSKYRLRSGLHVCIWEFGTGSRPIIALHGFGEGAYVWKETSRSLGGDYKIIAPDLAGHGESEQRKDGIYQTSQYADDCIEIVEKLNLTNFSLIGHSLGAEIAIRILPTLGNIVGTSLIDCGLNVDTEVLDHFLQLLRSENRHYNSIDQYVQVLESYRFLTPKETLRTIAKDALAPHANGGYRLKRDHRLETIEAITSDDSDVLIDCFKRIPCPVQLIRGTGSAIMSRTDMDQMCNLLPGCERAEIPYAGHSVMLDNPPDLALALAKFFTRLF